MAAPANSACILPNGKWKGSGRTTMSSYSCTVGHKLFVNANVILKGYPIYSPKAVSFTCKAGPNNHRRNPDFSRQHKGSSRGKNRPFQDRDNSDSLEESDPLPSKNGSLLSLSTNQRYSSTATPGKREKEIIELFRKVQAQLRQRAAAKEEKKMEASQQGSGERGTVDSLLKLLRKHSVTQGKKSVVEEETNVEDEQNSTFFSSDINEPSPDPLPSTRPPSKFKRRSPVPRVKFQPVFSTEEVYNISISDINSEVSTEELSDTEKEEVTTESVDLASMKLVELRELAKSRGMKGYSKLKKSELVELLS